MGGRLRWKVDGRYNRIKVHGRYMGGKSREKDDGRFI